jgi:hypothetical protein
MVRVWICKLWTFLNPLFMILAIMSSMIMISLPCIID